MSDDAWKPQLEALGSYIRTQRQLAKLSLRELANLTKLSNAYLSQIERGLHQPSVRVLKSVSDALDLSAEALLAQAGLLEESGPGTDKHASVTDTEATILADEKLTPSQREALLSVYRSFVPPDDEPAAPGV